MASRRDLIQSFQFAARRVVSAVVMRQTDPTEWPNRRLGGAGFGAVMVTVIALAAVGIYGMIVPGGKTSWKDGRSIIVVKETGAPYVYIEGKLHPVVNFTSAALLVGSTNVTLTSSASLEGVPRGVELGIPGAPMTLPKETDLVSPPWSLCSQRVLDQAGKPTSKTRLVVGRNPGQGFRPGEKGLVVTDDTKEKDQYLIWHDQRYLLRDLTVVRVALNLNRGSDIQVGDAWLKALPAGQDIAVHTVPGAGQPSTKVPGTKLGDLVDVTSSGKGTQHYLVDIDGLKSISDLQYAIQQVSYPSSVRSMSPSDVARANPAPPPPTTATQPPQSAPDLVKGLQSDTVVCAAYSDTSFAPQVLVNSAIPEGGGVPTSGTAGDGATTLADRVWVPPGKAALVESLTSPDAKDGPVYLVTDVGRRYAIRSTDVLRFLGLSTAKRISKLPAGLLVRIPEGPPLDPDDARAALQQEKADN